MRSDTCISDAGPKAPPKRRAMRQADAPNKLARTDSSSSSSGGDCSTSGADAAPACQPSGAARACPRGDPAAAAAAAATSTGELLVGDKYIKGTRLVIGGWFQACRGCNEPTAHTCDIGGRGVPFCPRCRDKYADMAAGNLPPHAAAAAGPAGADPAVEPLCYWLPRLLGRAAPRMDAAARRELCDRLVLRQDDAWLALIGSS